MRSVLGSYSLPPFRSNPFIVPQVARDCKGGTGRRRAWGGSHAPPHVVGGLHEVTKTPPQVGSLLGQGWLWPDKPFWQPGK